MSQQQKTTFYIFWGPGTYGCGAQEIQEMLEHFGYSVRRWTTFKFLEKNIKSGDTLVFPGGSASECFENLCEKNNLSEQQVKSKINSFIAQGINYLSVCAGSYMARLYFGLLPYKGSSSGMGNTGKVSLDIDPEYLVLNGNRDITYYQGPLYFKKIPSSFKVLATFSRVPDHTFYGINKNKYIGSPAILFKKGVAGDPMY